MSNAGEIQDKFVFFDSNYKPRPFPELGVPGFEEADMQAGAFLTCWLADFDNEVLHLILSKLSPLAVRIVKWGVAELECARIKTPVSTADTCGARFRPTVEHLADARLADDGNRLCDDNSQQT
jgi:hypothetical protein